MSWGAGLGVGWRVQVTTPGGVELVVHESQSYPFSGNLWGPLPHEPADDQQVTPDYHCTGVVFISSKADHLRKPVVDTSRPKQPQLL